MQGVGLLIANEGEGGRLLVLAPIKGGPADRAGIIPGDEVRCCLKRRQRVRGLFLEQSINQLLNFGLSTQICSLTCTPKTKL